MMMKDMCVFGRFKPHVHLYFQKIEHTLSQWGHTPFGSSKNLNLGGKFQSNGIFQKMGERKEMRIRASGSKLRLALVGREQRDRRSVRLYSGRTM